MYKLMNKCLKDSTIKEIKESNKVIIIFFFFKLIFYFIIRKTHFSILDVLNANIQ